MKEQTMLDSEVAESETLRKYRGMRLYGDNLQKFLDAEYILNPREVESIDRNVYKVVRRSEIIQKYIPTIPIPAGMKEHKVSTEVETDPPIFSDDWTTEDLDEVRKEETTFYTAYMHKDFAITKIDIDASRSSNYHNIDAKQLQIRGISGTMADYKERVLWRGYDIKGRSSANTQGSIDTNVKGILNTTGINTFEAGAGDDDVTAAGDGPASVSYALAELVADKYDGPYYFFMTPLIKAQLALNRNSNTDILDLERMLSMVDEKGNKILRGVATTEKLLNAAETTATGAMCMIDPMTPHGEPTVVIGEEYPVIHYPITNNPVYIKGKVVWGGMAMVLKPKAIASATAIDS